MSYGDFTDSEFEVFRATNPEKILFDFNFYRAGKTFCANFVICSRYLGDDRFYTGFFDGYSFIEPNGDLVAPTGDMVFRMKGKCENN